MNILLYIVDDVGLTAYSDDEDETAELMRELEKIKKERAAQREREVRRPFGGIVTKIYTDIS